MTATQCEVTIRSGFPSELAGKLWRWLNSPRGPNFDDFGPSTPEGFAKQLKQRLLHEITWAICADNEVVGYLAFSPANPIAGQCHGMVIAPNYRGRGIGTEAFRQAIQSLKELEFRSFTVMPFEDNAVIRHMLETLGFDNLYPPLFGASRIDGKPRNVSIYHLGVE